METRAPKQKKFNGIVYSFAYGFDREGDAKSQAKEFRESGDYKARVAKVIIRSRKGEHTTFYAVYVRRNK